MIKVFGHKNPDTDSVCSAIAYAWLLRETGTPAQAYALGQPNKEALFVLEHFKVETPPVLEALVEGDRVAVVDTNNPEELPEDLGVATLVEIVDHHKLVGGLSTPEPIAVTIRPVACTATVIWEQAMQAGVEIHQPIAGLMLSAILSDTLKFTSPTTTDRDRQAAEALVQLCGADADMLADQMFSAKSDLTGLTPTDLLTMDSKLFTFGASKVRVSTLETTNPERALELRDSLVAAMEEMKRNDGLDGVYFFVVDILKSEAVMLAPSRVEEEVAGRGFGVAAENGLLHLPGVVSRKKQIIPALEKALVG